MNKTTPNPRLGTFEGVIDNISVDINGANRRLVIPLRKNDGSREYFSAPLTNADSVRIAASQLKAALPGDLGTIAVGTEVFREMLLHKSRFIGKRVHFSVSEQTDKDGNVRRNPKTDEAYLNVRIEPDKSDLSAEQVDELLAGAGADTDDEDIPF